MQAMMGRNNCTCQGERSKAQLMETIGQSAFAAYDTLLYMDTHPQDREGHGLLPQTVGNPPGSHGRVRQTLRPSDNGSD